MQYRNNQEDELDRMRARHQKNREMKSHKGRRQRDDIEIIDLNQDEPVKRKKKSIKPHRRKPPVFAILFLFVALFAGIFIFRHDKGNGYWTVAVFGVDSRDGKTGKGALSDVEMLASINRKTGEIRLVSVFRDTYLKIDSEGTYDKVNEAYFLGGHEQGIQALQDNLDIHIDDYATFNWKAVVDAINVLGGVDLEITDKEFGYINSFITETVESTGVGSIHLQHSGMNHLDGVQAVAYARLRLMDTDFNRTERQRKILGLTMEKAKQADFKTLKTLVGTVYPQISTSIGVDDILSLAKNAKKYYIGQTSGFPFSHTEMKISKKACVIPTTLESNVTQLHAFLYDDTAYHPSGMVKKISAHISEKSGISEPGKDQESGKNVGAQGNNGGGQATPQTKPQPNESEAQTEVSPETETTVPETTEPETEETETESEEESIEESMEEETIAPMESTANDPSEEIGPGVQPSESTDKLPDTTHGSLEGPGQSDTRPELTGPGV